MVDRILDEFKMPVNGNKEIILRVIQGERINILQLIMDDKIIPINLIGYGANALFEVGNRFAIKYASLTELMPNFPPFTPTAQLFREQTSFSNRTTSPRSSAPFTFSKEITVDEAIAIIKKQAPKPDQRVKVQTTRDEMVDFIFKYKGGAELYIKGELKIFKDLNIFIDFKLFKDTIEKLVSERKIAERRKISRENHPYKVYIIPQELPAEPKRNTSNDSDKPLPAESEKSSFVAKERPSLPPVPKKQSPITDYLETLFYSFQDSELTLELFVSEAQYQKIPFEVARDFYIAKLEERNKRLFGKNK